jgi:hypothetical protein
VRCPHCLTYSDPEAHSGVCESCGRELPTELPEYLQGPRIAGASDKESRWFVGWPIAIITCVVAVALAVWAVIQFYLGG